MFFLMKIIVNNVHCLLRYGESFPVSAEVLDSSFTAPIGKAKVTLLLLFKYFRRWFPFCFGIHFLCLTLYLSILVDRKRREGCDYYCFLEDGGLCT